jgi:hypothetical protein
MTELGSQRKGQQCLQTSISNHWSEERDRAARWYIFRQKCQFWYILQGLGMKNIGVLHDNLEFFAILVYAIAIWYVCGHFFQNFVFCTKKNLATLQRDNAQPSQ